MATSRLDDVLRTKLKTKHNTREAFVFNFPPKVCTSNKDNWLLPIYITLILTHLVAELPHLQVKSSGVRQVKKISMVHWGAMPVNELSQAQENTQQLLVTLHLSCAVVIEIAGKFRFD